MSHKIENASELYQWSSHKQSSKSEKIPRSDLIGFMSIKLHVKFFRQSLAMCKLTDFKLSILYSLRSSQKQKE